MKYLAPALFAAPCVYSIASAVWYLMGSDSCNDLTALCVITANADVPQTLTVLYLGILGLILSLAISSYVGASNAQRVTLAVAITLVLGGASHLALSILALTGYTFGLPSSATGSSGATWSLVAYDAAMLLLGGSYLAVRKEARKKR
jgi:hypothetical protein